MSISKCQEKYQKNVVVEKMTFCWPLLSGGFYIVCSWEFPVVTKREVSRGHYEKLHLLPHCTMHQEQWEVWHWGRKREELESKSSHKSDIWPPAASKKWDEIYWKYIFQTLGAIFPYKGVFFTKVVKANIIAFIKTKILRPVLSVTNPPFQKCQPLLHSAMLE